MKKFKEFYQNNKRGIFTTLGIIGAGVVTTVLLSLKRDDHYNEEDVNYLEDDFIDFEDSTTEDVETQKDEKAE